MKKKVGIPVSIAIVAGLAWLYLQQARDGEGPTQQMVSPDSPGNHGGGLLANALATNSPVIPQPVAQTTNAMGAGVGDEQHYSICLISGTIDTKPIAEKAKASRTLQDKIADPWAQSRQSLTVEGRRPYIVQFDGPIDALWKEKLEETGGRICGYMPGNAYIVECNESILLAAAALEKVQWIGEYKPEYKIAPALKDEIAKMGGAPSVASTAQVDVIISALSPRHIAPVSESIRSTGGVIIEETPGRQWGLVRVAVPLGALDEISSMGEVEWMDRYIEPTPCNDLAVTGTLMNVQTVWSTMGLTGRGQIVAVADSGLDTGNEATLHPDFSGQVVKAIAWGRKSTGDWSDKSSNSNAPGGHGTHVAGSVLGNGSARADRRFKGVAYDAKLVFQSTGDANGGLSGIPIDLFPLFNEAELLGARIHNNSWGTASSNYYGNYLYNSRACDEYMWSNDDFLIVVAAGNEGRDNKSPYGVIEPNSVIPPTTAKNILSVGAAESHRPHSAGFGGYSSYAWAVGSWALKFPYAPIKADYISEPAVGSHQGMAAFSGRGPCDDGRTKPDIVAPGTDIISCRTTATGGYVQLLWGEFDNNYVYSGGTSMSTPLTAGAASLIRQYYVERCGMTNPSAALIKATVIVGARSMYPGQYGTTIPEISDDVPNNVEGWGHVNIGGSLAVGQGVSNQIIDRASLAAGGRHTYQFQVNSSTNVRVCLVWSDYPALLASSIQLVNNLDLALIGASGTNYPNSVNGPDVLNNTELISKTNCPPGQYQVVVSAPNVPLGPQKYALVVQGGTLSGRQVSAFEWRDVPAIANESVPFLATLRAIDGAGQIVPSYIGSNHIVAIRVPLNSSGNYELGIKTNSFPNNTSFTNDNNIGMRFYVNRRIRIISLQSKIGTRISLWDGNGNRLIDGSLTNGEGWRVLIPGTTVDVGGNNTSLVYCISAYVPAKTSFSYGVISGPITNIAGEVYDESTAVGDNFPNGSWVANYVFPVDMNYETLSTNELSAAISPTYTASFTNGVWSGAISVLQAASNVQLRAIGTNGIVGESRFFDVLPSIFTDVGVGVDAKTTDTVNAGSNILSTIYVTNFGPRSVTGLIVSHYTSPGLKRTSNLPASTGQYDSATGLWNIGNLGVGQVATVVVNVRVESGYGGQYLTNRASLLSINQQDTNTANNVSVKIVKVRGAGLAVTNTASNLFPAEGGTVTITTVVTNIGPDAANNAVVQYSWPGGLACLGHAPGGSLNTNTWQWQIASLAKGAAATLMITARVNTGTAGQTLTNVAVVSASEEDGNQKDNRSEVRLTVPLVDLRVTAAATPALPNAGDGVTFAVTVSNAGPHRATGVTITNNLPPFASSSPSVMNMGTYTAGVWRIPLLNIGEMGRIEMQGAVPVGVPGHWFTNRPVAYANEKDSNLANNTTNALIQVQGIDLSITQRVSTLHPNLGDKLTFSVVVSNSGPHMATGIVVSNRFMSRLSNVTMTVSSGTSQSGIWSNLTLSAFASASLSITGDVSVIAPITNIAEVIAARQEDVDSTPNDRTGDDYSQLVVVPQSADLAVTKSRTLDPASGGQTNLYTVTVSNKGPDSATGVVVEDILPTNYVWLASNQASVGVYSGGGGQWSNVVVAPGASATLRIWAGVKAGHGGEFVTNNARVVRADQWDPEASNNTDQAVFRINGVSVGLSSTTAPGNPNEGESVSLAVVLTNSGPDIAHGITVSNLWPTGLTYAGSASTAGTSFSTGTWVWTVSTLGASAAVQMSLTGIVKAATAGQTMTNTARILSVTEDDGNLNDNRADAIFTVPLVNLGVQTWVSPGGTNSEGDEVVFDVIVTNLGPHCATWVVVSNFPSVGIMITNGICTTGVFSGSAWSLNALDVLKGGRLSLQGRIQEGTHGKWLTNRVSVVAREKDGVSSNDTAGARIWIKEVDLSVTQKVSVVRPNVGGKLAITVTVSNNGPNTATSIVVTNNLSIGLSNVTKSVSSGTWQGDVWSNLTLDAYGSASLSITGFVAAISPITNVAEVIAAKQGDVDSTPNDRTGDDYSLLTVVPQSADLVVSKSRTLDPASGGQTNFYAVTVSNKGPDAATGIVVEDILPTNYVWLASNQASVGIYSGGGGQWSNVVVAPGTSATLRMWAGVKAGHGGEFVTNIARVVRADQWDPEASNNTDQAVFRINGVSVGVSASVSPPDQDEGELVVYSIRLTNSGPGTAHNVIIQNLWPSGLDFLGAGPARGTTFSTSVWQWGVASLAANQGARLMLTGAVRIATAGQVWTNTVRILSVNEEDSNPDDNERSVLLTVRSADLTVDISCAPNPVYPGSNVVFNIALSNAGPFAATDVVVMDVVPAPMQLISASIVPGTATAYGLSVTGQIDSLASGAKALMTITARCTNDLIVTNRVFVSSTRGDPRTDNNSDAVELRISPAQAQVEGRIYEDRNRNGSQDGDEPGLDGWGIDAFGTLAGDVVARASSHAIDLNSNGVVEANSESGFYKFEALSPGGVRLRQRPADGWMPVQPPGGERTLGLTNDQVLAGVLFGNSRQISDLHMRQTASPNSCRLGYPVVFTLTVSNAGPDEATGILVADAIQSAWAIVEGASVSTGHFEVVSNVVQGFIPRLSKTSTATISITSITARAGVFTNVGSVTFPGLDLIPGNDVNSTIVTTVPPAVLLLSPSVGEFGKSAIGLTNRLRFQIDNIGWSNLTGQAAVSGTYFRVAAGLTFNIAGSGRHYIDVDYVPQVVGVVTGMLTLSSNGGGAVIPLRGEGTLFTQATVRQTIQPAIPGQCVGQAPLGTLVFRRSIQVPPGLDSNAQGLITVVRAGDFNNSTPGRSENGAPYEGISVYGIQAAATGRYEWVFWPGVSGTAQVCDDPENRQVESFSFPQQDLLNCVIGGTADVEVAIGNSVDNCGYLDVVFDLVAHSANTGSNHIVRTSAGPHLSMNPNGLCTVQHGASLNVWIRADEYYSVGSVTANGETVETGANQQELSYVWRNVSADGSVEAVAKPTLAMNNLPEWWLARHGLPPFYEGATEDSDGDGHANWQEFCASTDPWDSNSFLNVEIKSSADGLPLLTWDTEASGSELPFVVMRSTSLTSGEWMEIDDQVVRSSPRTTWMDSGVSNRLLYYKILAKNDWGGICPTFIQLPIGTQQVPGVAFRDVSTNDLVGKIMVPIPGSLLKSDIPFYGVAGGTNYFSYRLEYGEGLAPTNWTLINQASAPENLGPRFDDIAWMQGDLDLRGNLGTWNTGLNNWEHLPWHPADESIDLNGIFTVRLEVTGKDGSRVKDEVMCEVGRAIAQCLPGIACSPDKRLTLYFPEQALMRPFRVYTIFPFSSLCLPVPDVPSGCNLVGTAYRIREPGDVFIKDVRMEIQPTTSNGPLDNHVGICRYDYSASKWEWLNTIQVPTSGIYRTSIRSLPESGTVYALIRDPLAVRSSVAPMNINPLSRVVAESQLAPLDCAFEKDLGPVTMRDFPVGAKLTRRARDTGGFCLELRQENAPGNSACTLLQETFDVRRYGRLRFDYRISPGAEIDLMLRVGSRWYSLCLAGSAADFYAKDVNIGNLGKAADILDDGAWHIANLDLEKHLSAQTGQHEVSEIALAKWDVSGFMKLELGSHRTGDLMWIDNLQLIANSHIAENAIRTVWVDRFNHMADMNELGGESGVFSGPNRNDGAVKQVIIGDGVEKVLSLEIGLSDKVKYGGYWTRMPGVNARDFDYVSLRLKIEPPLLAHLAISIGSEKEPAVRYEAMRYVSEADATGWRNIVIPIQGVGNRANFGALDMLTLGIDLAGEDANSIVLVDDLCLTKTKVYSGRLVVDDFEGSACEQNYLGGVSRAFANGAASAHASLNRLMDVGGNPAGSALLLGYGGMIGLDLGQDGFSFAGWRTELGGIDLSQHKSLTMRIRGANGGESPNIYLSDGVNRRQTSLEKYGAVGRDWKCIRIPLDEFQKKSIDLTHVEGIEVLFEWREQSGAIWIDDLAFE